jgi:hypothetical protein
MNAHLINANCCKQQRSRPKGTRSAMPEAIPVAAQRDRTLLKDNSNAHSASAIALIMNLAEY